MAELYNKGGKDEPFGTKSEKIKPLGLTDAEIEDLGTFLGSPFGSEIIVERPKPPPYGVLEFPMDEQGRANRKQVTTGCRNQQPSASAGAALGRADVGGGDPATVRFIGFTARSVTDTPMPGPANAIEVFGNSRQERR